MIIFAIPDSRSVNAMKESENAEVEAFVARWGSVLDELAEGEGTVVGFFFPIERNDEKTDMPCVLGWSNSQMFEQTNDVQQCVKVSFFHFKYLF